MRKDTDVRVVRDASAESCYLCGGLLPTSGFVVEAICFKRCLTCHMVVQTPLPRQDELTALYTGEYYESTETYAHPDDKESAAAQRRVLDERLAVLDALKPARGTLLDVGCGLGDFLRAAGGKGWRLCGIDASPHAVRVARERVDGVIVEGTLDTIQPDALGLGQSSLAAVTFWDVVEHLVDPRDILRRAHNLLEPSGILAISMPNVAGIKSRVLGRRWRYFRPQFGHVMHYSPPTLAWLARQAGFTVVSVQTQGFFNLGFARTRLPASLVERLPRPRLGGIQYVADRAAGRLGIGENMVLYARR